MFAPANPARRSDRHRLRWSSSGCSRKLRPYARVSPPLMTHRGAKTSEVQAMLTETTSRPATHSSMPDQRQDPHIALADWLAFRWAARRLPLACVPARTT
jgi:hypothetical protein